MIPLWLSVLSLSLFCFYVCLRSSVSSREMQSIVSCGHRLSLWPFCLHVLLALFLHMLYNSLLIFSIVTFFVHWIGIQQQRNTRTPSIRHFHIHRFHQVKLEKKNTSSIFKDALDVYQSHSITVFSILQIQIC